MNSMLLLMVIPTSEPISSMKVRTTTSQMVILQLCSDYAGLFSSILHKADYGEGDDGLQPGFVGKQIDLAEIPQYIREYDRGKDVELWKITYSRQ